MHALRCFAVAAEESNLHRAAQRLLISQPPLSRLIKKLEERLGLTLFVRHTKGLTLTKDGARVLEIIRPLLRLQEKTFARLADLAQPVGNIIALGLTTAFEQGVFSGMEAHLRERLRVTRETSPRLARAVRRGGLDAALVALPLEAPGLALRPLPYAEPLQAVLPESWPEARHGSPPLRALSGKSLFWFRRESNPAFFDHMRGVFAHVGFAPTYLEEPAEYDVLLARIASGEGLGLLPVSFAAIQRKGLVFAPLAEAALLRVQLGLAVLPGREELADELTRELSAMNWPHQRSRS